MIMKAEHGSSLVNHGTTSFMGDLDKKIKIIKKKKCSRRKLAVHRPLKNVGSAQMSSLQRLFLLCRYAFKGPGSVPSPTDIRRICHILGVMKPEDVGLNSGLQFFKPKGVAETPARVAYTTIYECKNFSLCIFFLPENATIPLHNHPGMTVLSKLLLGKMHIKSYDWVIDPAITSDNPPTLPNVRMARLKANSVFEAPCDTSVLYPTSGGNMHEFRAITPCAVLDVIGPPYSKDDGRDCSYYRDTPCDASLKAKEGDGIYAWLEEIETPNESEMDAIQYLGPKVSIS